MNHYIEDVKIGDYIIMNSQLKVHGIGCTKEQDGLHLKLHYDGAGVPLLRQVVSPPEADDEVILDIIPLGTKIGLRPIEGVFGFSIETRLGSEVELPMDLVHVRGSKDQDGALLLIGFSNSEDLKKYVFNYDELDGYYLCDSDGVKTCVH